LHQLARFVSAGFALLIIAGLTSIGLYSVVAGGLLNSVPVGRSGIGAPPVLVTIQAGQATPTPATASGTGDLSTPIPGLSSKAAPALAPVGAGGSANGPASANAQSSAGNPSAQSRTAASPGAQTQGAPAGSATTPIPGGASTGSSSGTPAPAPVDAATTAKPNKPGQPAATLASQPDGNHTVTHEGVAAEIVEVEHGWTPVGIDGVALNVQPGLDVVTVLMQLSNGSSELRYIGDGDILLVGSDGTRYAPRPTPMAREPHLLTMPIMPGDTVRGWQTYTVPQGVTIARAQWNPSRPDRAPGSAAYSLDLPH
jgi:hypothetical protein